MDMRAGHVVALLIVAGVLLGGAPAEPTQPQWVDLRHHGPSPYAGGLHVSEALVPIDQAVSDLDQLSHSLRLIEPGPARFPEHARVYRLHPDAPGMWTQLGDPVRDQVQRHTRHTYRYEAPGVQAWVRQPGYIVRGQPGEDPLVFHRPPQRDGEYLEMVPADTVFDLIPPSRRPAILARPIEPDDHSAQPDARLDYRIDTRIDTRIDAE